MEASPMDAGPLRIDIKMKSKTKTNNTIHTIHTVDDSGYNTFTPSSADVEFTPAPADGQGRSRLTADFKQIRLGERVSLRRQDAMDMETEEAEEIASSSLLNASNALNTFNVSPFDSSMKYSPIFRSRSVSKRRVDFGYDSSHATPKKTSSKDSGKTIKDARKIKRQIYRRASGLEKLGTPEKNMLLYSDIKKVTPSRKARPPTPPERPSTRLSPQSTRCGERHVDFLKLLDGQGPALKRVLVHLSDEDLHNVCKVSRTWKRVCSEDSHANRRQRRFVERSERNKENKSSSLEGKAPSVKFQTVQEKRPLTDVQNKCNVMAEKKPGLERSPPVSPRSRNHHKFVKAASLGSTLRGCITCKNPAVLNGQWATCQHLSCGIVFCSRCHYVRHHCERHDCKSLEPLSPNRISPSRITKKGIPMKKKLRRVLKFDNN